MSSDYSYDEQGQFYPFFIFTLSSLVTVPLTYSLLRPSTSASAVAPRIKTEYRPKDHDLIQAQRAAQKRRQRKVKRFIAVVLGWALMAFMMYLIMTTSRTIGKIWNPYEILGISESATEKQIKTHYKKLSLKFHPDKVRPDPAKNETLESMNDHYVELTKAYQALTDEDVRNNYIQYGHPDGKQSFSIGIALPKFIISDGNGKYVVLVYALLLGVLLPYTVGSWWYGTQRISKEGVLIESANNLFREYEENIDEGGITTALSSGREFSEQLKGDKAESGLSKIESRVLAAAALSEKDQEKLESLNGGLRRKVLSLLWAYLGRVELDDAVLNKAKYTVAPIAHALTSSFTAISLAFGNSVPILASFATSQRLIQALTPKASPLLQLPHFTPEVAEAVDAKTTDGKSNAHTTIQQFMNLSDEERQKLVVGRDLLSETQYKEAIAVATQLPQLKVAKAFFKVTGEKYITPGSLVSLVVKGRFIPPGSIDVPKVHEDDLEDVDPAEGDLKALKQEGGTILPPLAFAPRFARDHSPRWHVFLTDSKQDKMAVPPFTFATFDQPIFTADGKPTFNVQTLKGTFLAPPNPGTYTFVMHVVCDSYVGFDTKMEVTLVVEDANKAAAMTAEDEISDPDEGEYSHTIAGAMTALKGGKVKAHKEADEDSESDSEEEEEDSDSETNTDTDTDDE